MIDVRCRQLFFFFILIAWNILMLNKKVLHVVPYIPIALPTINTVQGSRLNYIYVLTRYLDTCVCVYVYIYSIVYR